MLIAAIAIWIVLLLVAVAFCRAAASADGKDLVLSARYPSRIAKRSGLEPSGRPDDQHRAGGVMGDLVWHRAQ